MSYPGMSSRGLSSRSLSSLSLKRAPSTFNLPITRSVQQSYGSSGGFDLSSALSGDGASIGVGGSEKMAMQNLNDRLASYLDKVHSLESANAQLERQIREWLSKQTPADRDYSRFEGIIADLRQKITGVKQGNAGLMLQIDNARLAAEDFRIKFENELAVRMSVEADIGGLRKVLDDLTMVRSDMEMQVEGLKEELVYLKKNHEEELATLRNQLNASHVNVEVEARPQQDLSQSMQEIRAQYEGIAEKNRREMDDWYKVKFDELNKQVTSSTETLQTSRNEINDLKRTLQALQIELQSQLSLKAALEGQLGETEARYSLQLSQLQEIVNNLEAELSSMKEDIERHGIDYQELLDTKTKLEMEIGEYKRLMDTEDVRNNEGTSVTTVTHNQSSTSREITTKTTISQRRGW
ncbi:keratin, type I cytoskeletal 13-like isoform X2 [Thalassophryne amazonica]|uniref:keratin, type I cytoskeletal 13-like isoform X2 n=1 Tax=Thalassophryne amazonica TaxID=390379 RepID=UPI0014708AAA|nr:keratin, type I cytoskeletal 13-like isoform X2 [Thalassophryne amazonica]